MDCLVYPIVSKMNYIMGADRWAVMCAQYATLCRRRSRSAIFRRFILENRTGSRSEVEDDAGDALEVVLVFAEEVVEHVIAFGA